MILLDSNVLSEFMRPNPSLEVVAWLDARPAQELFTCAVVRAEIELGLALMPEGRRREALLVAARTMFDEDFAGRCLPFDEAATTHYARIVAHRTRLCRPITIEDAQTAATALANRMVLATRNARDYDDIEGLRIVNPWGDS